MVEIYYYDYEILRVQIKDLCEWCISLCEAENNIKTS